MNSLINGDNDNNWTPDDKFEMEVADAFDRVQADLETGILTKFKVLRERQID